MDSGYNIWIPLAVAVFADCLVGTSGADLECVVNRCPDNERCLQRYVPGQPDYVCECVKPFFHGFDCTKTSNNNILATFYGENWATGSYTSPNYTTTGYNNLERILVLIYIPRATEIRFSFDHNFQTERNADQVHVGRGLTILYDDIASADNLTPNLYSFDGIGAPQPFSIYNDTAFIFFTSDREVTFAGFKIFWNATVADPPPTTKVATTKVATTEVATTSAASVIVFQTGLLTTLLIHTALAIYFHM